MQRHFLRVYIEGVKLALKELTSSNDLHVSVLASAQPHSG